MTEKQCLTISIAQEIAKYKAERDEAVRLLTKIIEQAEKDEGWSANLGVRLIEATNFLHKISAPTG